MVQDQLVDYISSQVKLGVSRDSIKSALVSAGWVSADVEDTLKKVMDGGSPAGVQAPAGGQPVQSSSSVTMGSLGKPAGANAFSSSNSSSPSSVPGKSGEPQMIRVSDLVSGSPSASKPATIGASGATSTSPKTSVSVTTPKTSDAQFGGKISGNTFKATTTPGVVVAEGSKKGLIGGIIAGVLIVGLAGAAWYFYSMNAALAAKVTSLTTESTSVSSQLASLQTQINASSTGFAAQIAALTTNNTDLALNLSFYVAPPGGAVTALPITISGLLAGGGKAPYSLTTSRGARIFVGNSNDANISGQLKPVVGQNVSLTGTYIPGSDSMTVNTVIPPPAP